MDLTTLGRIAWRWLWLILSVVLVASLVTAYRTRSAKPVYEAQVKLQLTAPLPNDVQLFDHPASSNLRDELTVARNNFMELLRSREVYARTAKQLGLQGTAAAYNLTIDPLRDSDFIYVTVQAATPQEAATIANAHVTAGLEYYGEVSSQPATAASSFLSDQLAAAEKDYTSATRAVSEFARVNNVGSVDGALASAQNVLERLQNSRNDLVTAKRDTKAVDTLLDQQRAEVNRLLGLQPIYMTLQEKQRQAKTTYELLLAKHGEAQLKNDNVTAASGVQVVEPAVAPAAAVGQKLAQTLALVVPGSAGIGMILALLLDGLVQIQGARMRRRAPRAVNRTEELDPNQSYKVS